MTIREYRLAANESERAAALSFVLQRDGAPLCSPGTVAKAIESAGDVRWLLGLGDDGEIGMVAGIANHGFRPGVHATIVTHSFVDDQTADAHYEEGVRAIAAEAAGDGGCEPEECDGGSWGTAIPTESPYTPRLLALFSEVEDQRESGVFTIVVGRFDQIIQE